MRTLLAAAMVCLGIYCDPLAAQETASDTAVIMNPVLIRVAKMQAVPKVFFDLGIGGHVMTRVRILPSGQADSVELRQSAGHPQLDRAAVALSRIARFQAEDTTRWALWPVSFLPEEMTLSEIEKAVCPPSIAFIPAMKGLAQVIRRPRSGVVFIVGAPPLPAPETTLVEVSTEIPETPYCNDFLVSALDQGDWESETMDSGLPLICVDDLCSGLEAPRIRLQLSRVETSWPGHEWRFYVEGYGAWVVTCDAQECSGRLGLYPLR